MEDDLVKMFLTKDGKHRVKIYYHTYAENPRFTTDEPLHCEDWRRDYSLMGQSERESKSNDARSLIEYFLTKYGKHNEIIDFLVDCGKHMEDGQHVIDDALVYDKSMHSWVLKEFCTHYDCEQRKNVLRWYDNDYFECKKQDIDIGELLECLQNDSIDYLVEHGYMGDKVKAAAYDFDYNGEVSFYPEISCDCKGICWLEHDEFMKYSGNEESYWEEHDCYDISKWLIEEIEAWSNNEVYGYVVEKAVRVQVMKTYFDGEREDESYIETNWEEVDSCWGYYGELSKNLEYMLSDAGFKLQDLDEVNC